MKTALVLSAGGMWGAYQAGAWKALESWLRPDLVVGVSAGALNGWAIAGGAPASDLIERWLNPLTAATMRQRRIRPFGPALFDPGPLEETARELYARYTPRVPFACTVAELPRLRLRLVPAEEMTWRHLVATCAVPVAFPPVRIGGKRYVDGGVREVLPLWAAGAMGASRAIAVDALPLMPSRLVRACCGILRWFAGDAPAPGPLEVWRITAGRPLGPLKSAIRWEERNIREWIRLGEQDGLKLGLCRSTGSTA
ncbi:MAG TPA: patatin-like phospholipase family protein [Bryobacteraceae bacterium]|nr:patatin-like phospholipase family protein [Bryobacteraceae bacterium]